MPDESVIDSAAGVDGEDASDLAVCDFGAPEILNVVYLEDVLAEESGQEQDHDEGPQRPSV